MIPRRSTKATQSSLGLNTPFPTIKDDVSTQAKPTTQKEKSEKQAIVARPAQSKTKKKEMGEGLTTMKAKAKQANQEENKEEKKEKHVKKRKTKLDNLDSVERIETRTRRNLIREKPKAPAQTPSSPIHPSQSAKEKR